MAEGCWRCRCAGCGQTIRWRGEIKDRPPCPACEPQVAREISIDPGLGHCEEVLEQCDRLLERIDEVPGHRENQLEAIHDRVMVIRLRVGMRMDVTANDQQFLDDTEDLLGRWSE